MRELKMLKQTEPNGSIKTNNMTNKSITDFIKPTIITAQQYGTKVSVEIDHSDTDIDELMYAFQTICVGLGYADSTWKNCIVDRADEYRETDAEELKEKLTEWQTDEDADWDVTLNDGLDEDESEYDDYGRVIEPNEALKLAAKKYKKNKKK